MKRLFLSILVIVIAVSAAAQYNNAYNYGYGMGLYQKGVWALCNGDYEEAFDYFNDGTSYNPQNWEGVGVCFELGFFVDKDNEMAWNCYKSGADYGNQACKLALQRIRQNGYYSISQRSTFLKNLRASQQSGGGSYGNYNSAPSNSHSKCLSCYGSGQCQTCGGTGKTGAWQNRCWTCNGTGRCVGCNGSGHY